MLAPSGGSRVDDVGTRCRSDGRLAGLFNLRGFLRWCLGYCLTDAGWIMRASWTMPLSRRRILQRRSQTVHMPPSVTSITEENTSLYAEMVSEEHICKESHAYIITLFLTNLARLALDALPRVGTHKVSNRAKVHASRMACRMSAKVQEYNRRGNQPLRPHSSQETISSGSPTLFFLSFPPQNPQFGSRRTLLFFFCGLAVSMASLTGGKWSGGGG